MTKAPSATSFNPALLGLLAVLLSSTMVRAQDLVPGAYTPAPTGFNIVTVAAVFSDGALAFDPSLPIEDASATIGGAGFGVNRTLNIAGRFANIGVGIPFVVGHVEGLVLDQFQQADRTGFGDMAIRTAVNLYGAPAMTRQQFAKYRATTIVGVSFVVGAPVGEYTSTRYVNLGTNRWSFKPELGFMRTRGRWTFEGDLGAVFFTDNTNYVNESTREQAPIAAFQGHLIYTWRPGFWLAGDGNYWKGGRITTNGTSAALEQKNSRIGATLAVPIRRHQWRFSYSFGAYTTIGGDYHSLGVSYSYAWAAARP
jgi:Putative MetA-pathway of phenol degradation